MTAAQAADLHGAQPSIRGLPFTRFYSFDEIGNVSAGARLSFDPLGRLAVIHEGEYVVLNDTTWLDMADKDSTAAAVLQVIADHDGTLYYGAFGSWGTVDFTPRGKLRARSLVPPSAPAWVKTANLTEMAITRAGVYFGGWNGVVFWDRASGEHVFFSGSGIRRLFALGDRVFLFAHGGGGHVQFIDVANRSLREIDEAPLEGSFIDQTTPLDAHHVLVATGDHRLLEFDGQKFTPWKSELGDRLSGRISSLKRLVDGDIAIAVNGKGLYLVSPQGERVVALTDSEHYRITDLAANEPGVLWVATETGVEKILYRSPVSVFGQRLGLPISWPQVVRWRDRVVVASGGRLYESRSESTGATAQFQPVAGQPPEQIWAIASSGSRMIVGNANTIFSRNDDGTFQQIVPGTDVSRLVMVTPDFCYFIGASEMGALHWVDGRWSECAPRIPGVGYPAVTHAAGHSAWIEVGGNRVVRLTFRDGRLQTQLFDHFPWKDTRWVNVSAIGEMVVLTGRPSGRAFFDEQKETFVDAPELRRVLDHAPYWITRVQQDEDGTLWATHDRGVFTLQRTGDGYVADTGAFDIINDRHPNIQLLPGGDVWFSTGQSLYHVDRRSVPEAKTTFKPVVASVSYGRSISGLYQHPGAAPLSFPYADNSVSFRFFSGSYAARRSPNYEFRLNGAPPGWSSLGSGSLLTLPNLREGAYQVDLRLADSQGAVGQPLSIEFKVRPPWFRTWYAYAFYCIATALATLGLLRWFVHRTNARNVELERLMQERTRELKIAMEKLNEETRNTATLAERDRLAGEIHDSVQQGLSGVMLQLDATLKMPAITHDVRSRLSVARNMISFTRHEVQHAVWNMESPLLDSAELGDALKKLAELVSAGAVQINLQVSGSPVALSSSTKHHLLRIAQEAITNAVRHAAPQNVTVLLVYEADRLLLTVGDDGCGFRPEEVLANTIGHFGLRGMRDRVSKIGGFLEIHSAPGEGASLRIVVPVSVPASAETHATTR